MATGTRDPLPAHQHKQGRRIPPELAEATMRAAGLEPLESFPGANVKWRCKCATCHKERTPTYATVKNGQGIGCRGCAVREATRRRMAARAPKPSKAELAQRKREAFIADAVEVMRAAGFEPIVPYPGRCDVGWQSHCRECKGVTTPRLSGVKEGRARCRHCSRRESRARQIAGRIEEILVVMRAADLEPLDPYVSTSTKWRSQCLRCKREVFPTFDGVQRSRTGIGCTYCSGGTTDPDEAVQFMLERGFEVLEPFPGNVYTDWAYRCLECKYEGSRPYFNTRTNGYGCPACFDTDRRVEPVYAAEVMRAGGFEPLAPFPGAREKWPCLCLKCGQECEPAYNRVTQGRGAGCCNTRFDLSWPGHQMGVYLVVNHDLDAAKVGIGMLKHGKSERIRDHTSRGWTLHGLWIGYPSLRVALDVEKSVLRQWREAGLPPHVTATLMPQRGHTETVWLGGIAIDQVSRFIDGISPAGVEAANLVA